MKLWSLVQLQVLAVAQSRVHFLDIRRSVDQSRGKRISRQPKRKRKELDSCGDEESWETLEELIAALADVKSKEEDTRGYLCQLQEHISLLKTEVVKYKLHNEYLEKQRRQGLAELIEEKRKAVDWGLRADTIVRRLKEQANKHLEMEARVEEAAWEVQEEARF
ncbi:hypothetical protein CR513_28626, partial [Mucuna pruriens]